jgi:hypothetical protein
MALLKTPFALWHLMAAIAVLAVSSALLRVNLALGTVAACVLSMTLVRTVHIVQPRRASGVTGSGRRWLHAGLDSLVVSATIIGSGDIAFLLVYGLAQHLGAARQSHGPPPEVDWNAVFVAIPSGLAVGFLMRCRLWDRRSVRGHSPDESDPADPPAAGR